MLHKVKSVIASAAVFAPLAAFAQGGFETITDSLQTIIDIANQYVIPIIIGAAVIYFLYGLVKYVGKAGDEGERANARYVMIYGIIIIFVMTAVWGFVNVLDDTLGLDRDIPNLPDVPPDNPQDFSR